MNDIPKISFVMPAKNAGTFIAEAVEPFLKTDSDGWELIIIDDHSDDNTYEIANEASLQNQCIKVYRNSGQGRIAALNDGYTKTRGSIIKTIDADDVLVPEIFEVLFQYADEEALCHAAYVTDQNLKPLGRYAVDKTVFQKDFEYCLRCVKGLPRWAWSFNRQLADKIFPMPESLTYEDVWMTLVIKKYSKSMRCLEECLYYYRQHGNQIYGGILSRDKETMAIRGDSILKLIQVLETDGVERLGSIVNDPETFSEMKTFCTWLVNKHMTFSELFHSSLCRELKLKALLYLKFNRIVAFALRVKWAIDRML